MRLIIMIQQQQQQQQFGFRLLATHFEVRARGSSSSSLAVIEALILYYILAWAPSIDYGQKEAKWIIVGASRLSSFSASLL